MRTSATRRCRRCLRDLPAERFRVNARARDDQRARDCDECRASARRRGSQPRSSGELDFAPFACIVGFFTDQPCERRARRVHSGARYCVDHAPADAEPMPAQGGGE